jgi:L,D-peptidoglycan transpeptidase YkuD (ErfK/YbiS/YcfS/YnhG family)
MDKTTRARLLLAGALLTALTGLVLAVAAPARAAGRPGETGPSRARPLVLARQLVTVTATSRGTTYATLRAYQVNGTRKTLVFGPWTARVGYRGIAAPGAKREGDGRTPSGTYGFGFFFGVDPNPGVAFPYRHAYPYDYWDDDPASARYNLWVDARTASAGRKPEPMHNIPAYDYAAVISYNTARTPGLGSAIFLHAATGHATAGCVSLPAAELLRVLRWLRPGEHPAITVTAR